MPADGSPGHVSRTSTPARPSVTPTIGYVDIETFIVELPAPYDMETMESLVQVVRPMVADRMT
jgi:hypothetical protein